MAKAKTFTVQIGVEAQVEVEVQAKSMAEAVEKATAIEFHDIVKLEGHNGINDYSLKVTGVFGA